MAEWKVIHQHKDFVIVDKPSGWTVYPEDGSDPRKSMLAVVREMFGHEIYPVHRLDKGTSGILLFARNQRASKDLQELFAKHKVKKVYLAIVYGHVTKDFTSKERLSHKEKKNLSAETGYEVLATGMFKHDTPVSLVRCLPKSGRFHQIRKHLKTSGFPVLGDTTSSSKQDLMLAAIEIEFPHPKTGEKISVNRSRDNRVQDFWRRQVKKV